MKTKFEDLQNFLNSIKRNNKEFNNIILYKSDIRCGKRVALAIEGAHGTLSIKTDFILYPEMNQFLRGYMFRSENAFAA